MKEWNKGKNGLVLVWVKYGLNGVGFVQGIKPVSE
jgi:hypothetical protein